MTEAFSEQFLPTVGVLGSGRIGFAFSQARDIVMALTMLGVDAGRRSVEKASTAGGVGRFDGVKIDESVVVKCLTVVFGDKPHAAHVGRQGEDPFDLMAGLSAGLWVAKIAQKKFVSRTCLEFRVLKVDPANPVALIFEPSGQVMPDEAPCSGN